MDHELEAIRQQRSQHQSNLINCGNLARAGRSSRDPGQIESGSTTLYFGHDIEMVRSDPARPAKDLRVGAHTTVLKLIRAQHQLSKRDMCRREPTRSKAKIAPAIARRVWLHRRNLECGWLQVGPRCLG